MKKHTIPLLLSASLAIYSCVSEPSPKVPVHTYYDVKGLLEQQVQLLSGKSVKTTKVSVLNGKKDSLEMSLDSAGWSKELEVFYTIDINSPALADAYTLQEELQDRESNLKVITYSAKAPEEVEVSKLEIYYFKRPEQVRKIKALYDDSNTLYHQSNEVELTFDETEDGHILLQSYRLKGHQKMILRDDLDYEVHGEVNF